MFLSSHLQASPYAHRVPCLPMNKLFFKLDPHFTINDHNSTIMRSCEFEQRNLVSVHGILPTSTLVSSLILSKISIETDGCLVVLIT